MTKPSTDKEPTPPKIIPPQKHIELPTDAPEIEKSKIEIINRIEPDKPWPRR